MQKPEPFFLRISDNSHKTLPEILQSSAASNENPPGENSSAEKSDGKNTVQEISAKEKTERAFRLLLKIANAPLSELQKRNPSLLVFPDFLGKHNDRIEEQKIFEMFGSPENAAGVKITTGNIMGFVGISGGTEADGIQFEITSRFAGGGDDFFLHYMLSKVFALNLFDLKHLSGDGQFDFLIFLFPYFLKKALSQGMFRTYRFFRRNDANVKGALDVSRHIRENIPFRAKISYGTRERSFDNSVTQLVRHTIEAVKTRAAGKAVLNRSEEIRAAVLQIAEATPSYSVQCRQKIIAQNAKPLSHPYYTAWNALQKICLAILRFQKLKYGSAENQIYGILFDGAWLWEEYLATLLKKEGLTHAENNTGKKPVLLWRGNPRYPDFYTGSQKSFRQDGKIPEDNFILDAKYKYLDGKSVSRDDAHQIVTYMHILPAKRAGLAYPCKADGSGFSGEQKSYEVYGLGGKVSVIGLKIPQNAQSAEQFAKKIKTAEDDFCASVKKA